MNPDLAARRPDRLIARDAGVVSRDYIMPPQILHILPSLPNLTRNGEGRRERG